MSLRSDLKYLSEVFEDEPLETYIVYNESEITDVDGAIWIVFTL